MKQVASGINGLDKILDGGLLRPSIVLVAGAAGTGKTTFVMQSLFNAARNEEICMYISALSEPIAMINNFMSKFSFYNISLLAKGNIKYVPINMEIIHQGPGAIVNEMEKNIEAIKPDRIVIDPVNVFTLEQNEESRRQFYYEFFTRMKGWNSLVLLTGEFSHDELIESTLSYLVDGIINISYEPLLHRNNRYINVIKMRGIDFHGGKQSCKITKDGFIVYPRLPVHSRQSMPKERISTGIKGLNQMTGGGYIAGSSILLSGSSGTGKSIIGTQFIMEGLLKKEHAVIISLEEDALQIRENSKMFGWDLKEFEDNKQLRIISALDFDIQELTTHMDDTITAINPGRMLFDGISRLHQRLPQSMPLPEYMEEIVNYLKNKNITALYTNETSKLTGATQITGNGISPLMDAVILLRYVEIKSKMHKAISVLKIRGSDHDKDIREIVIDKKGVEIRLPFSNYSGILSGSPTKTPSDAFVEAFKS